ncbi:transforming growth factor beta activator LRRC33 [Gastrophryne carolinensis]
MSRDIFQRQARVRSWEVGESMDETGGWSWSCQGYASRSESKRDVKGLDRTVVKRTPANDMAIVFLWYILSWVYLILFHWSYNANGERRVSKNGCQLMSAVADCRQLQLTSIPEDISSSIQQLLLDHNQINHLNKNTLQRYSDLNNLSLGSNSLASLERNIFQNIVKLEFLSLQDNTISSNYINVSEGLISASSLKWLDLSRNGLSVDMVTMLLKNLTSLEYLNLSYNVIMSLDSSVFKELPVLKELILQNNYIYEIESGTFEHLKNLRMLNLAFNLLPCIQDFGLTQLQILNLSFNHIEWFLSREDDAEFQLEKLDISYNQLFYFPLLPKHHHLHTLLLSDNQMKYYAQLFEANSSLVDFLILQNNISNIITVNLWEEYIPSDLSTLQIVDLSRNQFDYLPDTLVSSMVSLSQLKLNWNCLKTFDLSHGHISKALKTLDLSNNELLELRINTSSQTLPELVYLNLSQNSLKELPRQIFSTMTSLDTLDLSHNLIHLCSYLEDFSTADQTCVDLNRASIRHLRLSDCGLNLDTEVVFQGIQLTHLDISRNPLRSLRFLKDTASTLNILSLRNSVTLINEVDFSDFPALVSLDLSQNGITTFPKSLITMSLRYLDVSDNKLCSLPLSGGYHPLTRNLNTIFLRKNPFDCCKRSWFSALRSLSSINIADLQEMTCNFSNIYMSMPELPDAVLRSCEWTTGGTLLSVVLIVPTSITLLVALLVLILTFKHSLLKSIKRCFRTSSY